MNQQQHEKGYAISLQILQKGVLWAEFDERREE
jgi:hypothetical protein